MSENDFNRHLMHADLSGGTGTAPKAMGSAAAIRQLVMALPDGIGFVRVANVNNSVKVVSVDGIAAGQSSYKVKSGK